VLFPQPVERVWRSWRLVLGGKLSHCICVTGCEMRALVILQRQSAWQWAHSSLVSAAVAAMKTDAKCQKHLNRPNQKKTGWPPVRERGGATTPQDAFIAMIQTVRSPRCRRLFVRVLAQLVTRANLLRHLLARRSSVEFVQSFISTSRRTRATTIQWGKESMQQRPSHAQNPCETRSSNTK